MKITKFGHSCLLLEEQGVRMLIDPGEYSMQQNEVKGIHFVFITHEHEDHCAIDSLRAILKNNPGVTIFTQSGVGLILEKEGIPFNVVTKEQQFDAQGVLIEPFGTTHAFLHPEIPPVLNTGYFIARRFFYPGDAFTDPQKPIEILALPVAGPWMKIAEGIDYALMLKPKLCFPVHDGILKSFGGSHIAPAKVLAAHGIEFRVLEIGQEYEL